MQTIYAFSYNPVIATGTNTTGTNWRMAYQQPIMLYKGTTNQVRLVVFTVKQKVVDLTNYTVQVQLVDRETEEHFVTKTASITAPTSGVATITFTEEDLRNLQNRFYHLIAKLIGPSDGSSVVAGEILYLDDNYGAFTPITVENAWNYNPTSISTVDGIPEISFTNIRETPDSLDGQAGKFLRVNSASNAIEFADFLSFDRSIIPNINETFNLGDIGRRWGMVFANRVNVGNICIYGTQLGCENSPQLDFRVLSQTVRVTDNSTDPAHLVGDGVFVEFNDTTHDNDGPRLEVWYGEQDNPNDPPGQHSLDIRAAANSYVELASHDLNSFIGIDDIGPFIQTQWQADQSKSWRFLGDGELRLPSIGSRITSENSKLQIVMTFDDIRLTTTSADNVTTYQTIFDSSGKTFFPGDLLPGTTNFPDPDPTIQFNLGSPERPWKDLYLSNSTIYLGNVPISVDNTGTLTVNGNAITGGEVVTSPVQPYIELTNDPFIFNPYAGNLVTFTKDDYGNQVDQIDVNVAITRANNKGIYNPKLEADWDDTTSDGLSPVGTLWNKDGWSVLTNLNQRTYLSFYETFLRFGNNVLTAEAVMYDTANDKYYTFDFTQWGNSNIGAPLTYVRTQIDPVTGTQIGSAVTFIKPGYADPTQINDPIDTNLTIARGNNQSIYNIALEQGYSTAGDGRDSPEGTEWNADGWGQLRDVTQRTYDTFYSVLNQAIGDNVIGKELIMHDMINDKYYAVKFSSWTQNGEGGGFSYTRQLLNTNNLFVKPDNNNSVIDIFVEDVGEASGIGITRDNNNGIYNPYREEGWNNNLSPVGTLWNVDGWDDLSNITTRSYTNFYAAYGNGQLGNRVPGSRAIVYIPETNKYYAIQWLSWTQGGGGGFSYLRYELDITKLQEGVKFADGTVLKSATGLGRVKSSTSGNRRIEEVVGSKTVSVTQVTTQTITATASRSVVDDNRFWVSNTATDIAAIMNNFNAFGIQDQSTIQFSLDNSTWYTYSSSYSGTSTEIGVYCSGGPFTYNEGDTIYFRYDTGAAPVVWWTTADLPGGSAGFRGAVIDYHAYTGDGTIIGTIHIVDDSGNESISHTEVSSGSSDSENDDLWLVQNEGTISYRRIDGEAKTLKIHWTAKVFYGSEFYD
jgi:hypothetical protein